jgi:flagellar protein FlaG
MNVNQISNNVSPPLTATTSGQTVPPAGANPASAAAPAQAAVKKTLPPPSGADEVRKAAQQVNAALKATASSDLQFSVEGDNKDVVVRVVDSQTKELIRQIPSEEMVAISKAMDNLSGLLVQQKT